MILYGDFKAFEWRGEHAIKIVISETAHQKAFRKTS
jgi:hypothetical protein